MVHARMSRAVLVRILWLMLAIPCAAIAQEGAPAPRPQAVPVTTAQVTRQDVPVIARAIGTVQAFQAVTVRARVDGTLDRVLFNEGQRVKPGEVLAQIDPRPYQALLDQVLAKKAADEAMLASTRADLARYAELANMQVASRQKWEQTRAAVLQGEANVRGDEAAIAAAQLNLSFTRITSPVDGRVGLRQIDPGNLIRVSDPSTTGIVAINQTQPISVLFTAPQDFLPRIQAAMRRGKLAVAAYSSDDKTQLSEGELLAVDSAIDPATGSVKLKAVFANADEALWPGQFVNVRLQLDVRQNVPAVPSAAVQRGPHGLYVFVVQQDSTVKLQPVEVTQDDGKLAVLSSGLQGGETVVTAGQSRLANGTRVSANPPTSAS